MQQQTKSVIYEHLKYTRPCDAALRNEPCYTSTCTFAHSLEELRLPTCINGDNCIYQKSCKNKHLFESDDEYKKRVNYITPRLPVKRLSTDKVDTDNSTKIVFNVNVGDNEQLKRIVEFLFNENVKYTVYPKQCENDDKTKLDEDILNITKIEL